MFANHFFFIQTEGTLCVSVRLCSAVVKLTDNPYPELLQSSPCMFSKPSIPLAAGQLFGIVPLLQIIACPGLIVIQLCINSFSLQEKFSHCRTHGKSAGIETGKNPHG